MTTPPVASEPTTNPKLISTNLVVAPGHCAQDCPCCVPDCEGTCFHYKFSIWLATNYPALAVSFHIDIVEHAANIAADVFTPHTPDVRPETLRDHDRTIREDERQKVLDELPFCQRCCEICDKSIVMNVREDATQKENKRVLIWAEKIRDMVDDTKDLSDEYRVKGISSCVQSELTDIMRDIDIFCDSLRLPPQPPKEHP